MGFARSYHPGANIGDPNSGNRNSLIAAFYGLPLGVPRGSIRGVLAIIIVFGSIAFLAISMLKGDAYKFPDALTGILGAILGFYFGKGQQRRWTGRAGGCRGQRRCA